MSRKERILKLVQQSFQPNYLSVENESHKHHVPEGSETHFRLLMVSDHFKDLTRINRHRAINRLLAEELANGMHALSLHLYTVEEWEKRNRTSHTSPACRDGYRHG
ncbi:BolA family protein [Legionella jordanis]|uniref:Regulator of penicillin binding proteins and beta lactamase transcription (Morphogene) n=1 Tax=Legionella jordanis TaxID=456 RepID=A0A0W0VE40_9GAMM|nr:BolA/IbaG family iron-sulfur metabolism protein [Legionella jordanis]KTD18412.1 regulator of penicillin binding proteins and beta lactamase transcription (morphogene) [Legionella jordanis]RMX05318.1 BolA family transcriptional regulator [Legionella jordanis]RMX20831.1 BolA family transcriptional regulator [Legionella jordanis]VEH13242.1 regulator of penicillin binding proteins and beta lactamase transcription (morphogene) [Legionella jordanis]HAT8713593.1 BolA/IbaG family iron-sulfur metabo